MPVVLVNNEEQQQHLDGGMVARLSKMIKKQGK